VSVPTRGGFFGGPSGDHLSMNILWIILIVVLILALLGFFSRGRW
jgi:uncharacterized membrane protein